MKKSLNEPILLPQTESDFDALIDKLVKDFKLKSRAHTLGVVINRIQHMPPDQNMVTLEYLAACVQKNNAYQLADFVGKKAAFAAHKAQIDDLVAAMQSDPGNLEARDHLERLAAGKDGSKLAQAALKELYGEDPDAAMDPSAGPQADGPTQ